MGPTIVWLLDHLRAVEGALLFVAIGCVLAALLLVLGVLLKERKS